MSLRECVLGIIWTLLWTIWATGQVTVGLATVRQVTAEPLPKSAFAGLEEGQTWAP